MIKDTISFRRLFLLLCVIWAILDFSVLFRGRVLPWDAINEFYPTVYFNAHSLRTGELPWWNPFIYGGYPQIGDPQGMLFSPLLMAWMLVPVHPGASWFGWGVLLHVLMGGTAMLALLRGRGTHAFGSLVGATVFMAGGVAASRLQHPPIVIAYAYVPVVLLALRHFLARPLLLRAGLLGLAAGALVTQLVQVTYLFVFVVLAYGCVAVARRWRRYDMPARWRLCAGLLLSALVALAMGLPQLVFSWASMSLSNRVDVPLSSASAGSVDLRALWYLPFPNAYGGLSDLAKAPFDPVQSFLYIGVIPLVAVACAMRAWRSRADRLAIGGLAGLAVVSAIYMFGTNTPVYGWLYGWVPGLTYLRRPSDAAYVFNFALAFLAGIGAGRMDVLSRRQMTALLTVVALWLAVSALSMHRSHAGFLAAIVAGIAAWRLRTPGGEWRAVLWVMAVLVADYRAFNFNGTFNASADEAARHVKSPEVAYLSTALGPDGVASTGRIATRDAGAIWDDGGMLVGLASAQGYNPLRYDLYEKWYAPREAFFFRTAPSPYNALPKARLDDLLGVRYLVVGKDRPDIDGPPPGYRLARSFRYVEIWRNDGAYPRFLHPKRARMLGVGTMPDVSEFVDTDFSDTVWLTPRDHEDRVAAEAAADNCHGAVRSEVAHISNTAQTLRTYAASPGWVVAADLDYPGWKAELDGQPMPIHRANGMFRAVCVAAGEHELRFTFHPWEMVAYAWGHRA